MLDRRMLRCVRGPVAAAAIEGVLNIESKLRRSFAANTNVYYDATLQRVP